MGFIYVNGFVFYLIQRRKHIGITSISVELMQSVCIDSKGPECSITCIVGYEVIINRSIITHFLTNDSHIYLVVRKNRIVHYLNRNFLCMDFQNCHTE